MICMTSKNVNSFWWNKKEETGKRLFSFFFIFVYEGELVGEGVGLFVNDVMYFYICN